MLISHPHKFIAIKSMKTAGTSVEMFFQPACMPKGMQVLEWTPALTSAEGVVGRRGPPPSDRSSETWSNHMTAAAIKAQVPPDVWDDYLKFGMLRNPFSRIVSHYFFDLKKQNRQPPTDWSDLIDQFDAYVQRKRGDYVDLFFLDGQCVLDDLIYFESLNDDIRRVAARVDFPCNAASLPHTKKATNKPEGRHTADYFDTKRTDLVLKTDARAFSLGGYSANPADALLRPRTPSRPHLHKNRVFAAANLSEHIE